MPIVDIEIVGSLSGADPGTLAQALADATGAALAAAPGTTWVRVRTLATDAYAESGGAPDGDAPVFVTITCRSLPAPAALATEAAAVCAAVARATGRARERVHVEYAPPAAGRIAFGGVLAQ